MPPPAAPYTQAVRRQRRRVRPPVRAPEAAPDLQRAPALEQTAAQQLLAGPEQATPAGVLALQGTSGNKAVQRWLFGPEPSAREKIDQALTAKDAAYVKAIGDFSAATNTERYLLIEILLNQGWVGPSDETALQELWKSFDNIPAAASKRMDLWKQSQETGAELDTLGVVVNARDAFVQDVYGKVYGYLDENLAFVQDERKRLGLDQKETSVEQAVALAEVQKAATALAQARKGQSALRDIDVGMDFVRGDFIPFKFDPERQPLLRGRPEQGFANWFEIKKGHDNMQRLIDGLLTAFPTLYAAGRGDEGGVQKLGDADPGAARAIVDQTLTALSDNIIATRPKIGEALPYTDFQPIHAQLFGGAVSDSGTRWNQPFYKWVAETDLAAHESAEFWKALGLATLSAGAFIVAGLATGGLSVAATAVGVGIGAVQAGQSWNKYLDLATANKTNISAESELVTQGQVNMALVSAVLDTVFVLLDAYAPLKAGLRSIKGLPSVAALDEFVEAGAAARKAGGEGVEEAAELSVKGKFDLHKKLSLLREGAMTRPQAEAALTEAIGQFGEAEAIRRGGGWKHLANVLGNDSTMGKRLYKWRDSVWTDLQAFVTKQGGQVKRTGSVGQFSNDLDVSFLGSTASESLEEARAFLAGRLGVGVNDVEKVLNGSLFTDPRRMHLYDLPGLAPGVREAAAKETAAYEEKMVWNVRLKTAQESGDKLLEQEITENMKKLGIPTDKLVGLNKGDRMVLSKEIDQLHGELDQAIARGDAESQKSLIKRIAQKQAQINMVEKEGYLTAGGVRTQVTQREIERLQKELQKAMESENAQDIVKYSNELANLGEFVAATARPRLAEQIYLNALDQLPMLDKVAEEFLPRFMNPKATAAEVADALKGIGKYAGRFSEEVQAVAKSLKLKLPTPAEFAELVTTAKNGAVDAATQLRANHMLNELEETHMRVLTALREKAGLVGVTADSTFKIQALTAAHIKLVRALDLARDQLLSLSLQTGKAAIAPRPSQSI